MSFTLEETTRYSRQLRLEEVGAAGQEKLKNSRVAIIGAGGLGCPVISQLVGAGVGYIRVIDGDVVSGSNIHRQNLYSSNDVGKRKVEVLQEKLPDFNHNVNFDFVGAMLDSQNGNRLLLDVDVVVDGSDNFATRYLVNDICKANGTVLVSASIYKFEGQLTVFHHLGSPGLRSLYPHPPAAEDRPACSEIGVLGVVPAIVGSLQANEVLKIILGIGEVLAGKLLVLNCLNLKTSVLDYSKTSAELEKSNEIVDVCSNPVVGQLVSFNEVLNSAEYYLVDVRTEDEHVNYNIGGVCIPLQELELKQKEFPKDRKLLLYCKSGMRSNLAAKILIESVSEDSIYQVHGGIEAVPSKYWQSN